MVEAREGRAVGLGCVGGGRTGVEKWLARRAYPLFEAWLMCEMDVRRHATRGVGVKLWCQGRRVSAADITMFCSEETDSL